MLYEKASLTMEEVKATLNLKEIQRNSESKKGKVAKGQDKKDLKSKKSSRLKSKGKKRKCFIYDKEEHLKKDCLNNKDQSNERNKHTWDVVVAQDDYRSRFP
ncbi:hypothetical protein CR513_06835, partial [Mucuna pruriens]